MRHLTDCSLYGILDTGYCQPEQMPDMLRQMIAGGIHIVQLRAKGYGAHDVADIARMLLPLSREAGVPFVINDWPAVAREVQAQGAHVGQDDLSVAEARELAGPGIWIGKSTHSLDQATAAAAAGADCIGFGPLFATPTKPDYTPIGTGEIQRVHQLVNVPIFCIGGIKRDHIPALRQAGVQRVVIVSGILNAPDPAAYVAECSALLTA